MPPRRTTRRRHDAGVISIAAGYRRSRNWRTEFILPSGHIVVRGAQKSGVDVGWEVPLRLGTARVSSAQTKPPSAAVPTSLKTASFGSAVRSASGGTAPPSAAGSPATPSTGTLPSCRSRSSHLAESPSCAAARTSPPWRRAAARPPPPAETLAAPRTPHRSLKHDAQSKAASPPVAARPRVVEQAGTDEAAARAGVATDRQPIRDVSRTGRDHLGRPPLSRRLEHPRFRTIRQQEAVVVGPVDAFSAAAALAVRLEQRRDHLDALTRRGRPFERQPHKIHSQQSFALAVRLDGPHRLVPHAETIRIRVHLSPPEPARTREDAGVRRRHLRYLDVRTLERRARRASPPPPRSPLDCHAAGPNSCRRAQIRRRSRRPAQRRCRRSAAEGFFGCSVAGSTGPP